eukprot:g4047.t1
MNLHITGRRGGKYFLIGSKTVRFSEGENSEKLHNRQANHVIAPTSTKLFEKFLRTFVVCFGLVFFRFRVFSENAGRADTTARAQ